MRKLLETILQKIYKLDKKHHQDFRVPIIINKWNNILSNLKFTPIIKKYRPNSQFWNIYIRSFTNKIGNDLGIGALAFRYS